MFGAGCMVHVSGPGRLGLEGGSCRRRSRRIIHRIKVGLRYCTQEWALCCGHLHPFPRSGYAITDFRNIFIFFILIPELRTKSKKMTGSLSSCYLRLEMDLLTLKGAPTMWPYLTCSQMRSVSWPLTPWAVSDYDHPGQSFSHPVN